jgi:4-amino-4-deoxy-L-arabinose transferase-like glycosyltransferase
MSKTLLGIFPPPRTANSGAPPVAATTLALATFFVLMGATWFQHTDVGDAQVYQVIARHMVRDHRWTSLRYLPAVHPEFYEHLPFGLWPIAAAIGWLGEWAVIPLFALFALGIVALTGIIARRLAGGWTGLVAMLVLGTTEAFFFQASYPTLDPLLTLLALGAAVPVLTGAPGARDWLLAGALAAAAIAVKGPFGPLPLAGAVVARAVVDRSWRTLFIGGAVLGLAAVPVAAFLYARSDWWSGYFVQQVVYSLTGVRSDGTSHPLYAVRAIAGRFWPWLPALIPALVIAVRWPPSWQRHLIGGDSARARLQRACRMLLIASFLVIVGLSIPQRKLWHHTLIVYPFLSILVALGIAPWLSSYFSTPQRVHRAVRVLGAVVLICAGAVACGLGHLLMNPPCVVAAEFSGELGRVTPGQEVLVVSNGDEWDMLSALAFERDVIPWPSERLNGSEHPSARIAIVKAETWSPNPEWREIKRSRGWIMAVRAAHPLQSE